MKNVTLLLVLLVFLASGAFAQEEIKPSKFENVSWHEIVLIDFKPGKVTRAQEIIKIYQAAGTAAQTPKPELHWLMSGEYDMMLIWTMKDGPADFEWKLSPDGLKWRKELTKQLGSEEEVKKLQEEYSGLVLKTTSYISRKDL